LANCLHRSRALQKFESEPEMRPTRSVRRNTSGHSDRLLERRATNVIALRELESSALVATNRRSPWTSAERYSGDVCDGLSVTASGTENDRGDARIRIRLSAAWASFLRVEQAACWSLGLRPRSWQV